jgi:hypothetical protein
MLFSTLEPWIRAFNSGWPSPGTGDYSSTCHEHKSYNWNIRESKAEDSSVVWINTCLQECAADTTYLGMRGTKSLLTIEAGYKRWIIPLPWHYLGARLPQSCCSCTANNSNCPWMIQVSLLSKE